MAIKLTLQGKEKVINGFKDVENGLESFRKPLQKSADLLMNTFDRNFSSKGAELGAGWKPRKHSYPWAILQKTGKLRKGFNDKVNDRMAIVDNPVSYFKFHQQGTSRLPVRLMLKLDNQRERQVINIFEAFLKKQVNKF